MKSILVSSISLIVAFVAMGVIMASHSTSQPVPVGAWVYFRTSYPLRSAQIRVEQLTRQSDGSCVNSSSGSASIPPGGAPVEERWIALDHLTCQVMIERGNPPAGVLPGQLPTLGRKGRGTSPRAWGNSSRSSSLEPEAPDTSAARLARRQHQPRFHPYFGRSHRLPEEWIH